MCARRVDEMYEGVISLVFNDCSDDLDHGRYPSATSQHTNVSVLCVCGQGVVCVVSQGGSSY